jgi:hypothetical protein
MKLFNKNKIVLSLLSASLLSMGLHAADWLSIAGTQPDFIKKDGKKIENHNNKPHFWGFIQVGYQKDYGTILDKAGINKTPFVMLPPSLDTQSGFEVNRARLAVRGMVDKDNQLDYFFMTEFGEDGITKPAGHATHNYLTDASITYNGIPYVHVRAGQFKYPGSEEGMRAVFASEYRNFSTAGNQLLLERFLPNNATAGTDANGDIVYTAAPTQSVGAYRDRGVEVFNTTHIKKNITLSVAGMAGNGTGLSSANASDKMTYYGYLSTEYLFGKGKGYYTQAAKAYVWYQDGKRKLNNINYDRERYGLGIDYFHNGLRVDVEYIKAKGMIFNGAKDTSNAAFTDDWAYQIAAEKKNVADGGFVSAQYYVIPKKVELLARYDYLNRLTNSVKDERDFKTTTIGMSYHFKGPNRIDVNYAFRDITAPGNSNAQKVLDHGDNLLSIQGTIKF